MKNISLGVLLSLFVSFAFANNIGTDYQNFNSSITGLDFTTVHSSQTLPPCFCNLGVFVNSAKNTLTYSDTYLSAAGNQNLKGIRANDIMTAADLNIAIGITDNWDFGVALPFVVAAQNDDPYGVSYFETFGLTEIRPMTKYRFYGDDNGGLAFVFSVNLNQIQDNPFAGQNPGATLNGEVVWDTTFNNAWKFGVNLGYRKRNPGPKITNPSTGEAPPFVPNKDSVIYSMAGATRWNAIKSDIVAELKGSSAIDSSLDQDTKRSQQALEWGLGLRHEWSKALNIHGGVGTKLADAQSSPDFRAYVGVNLQFGPVCGEPEPLPVEYPVAIVDNAPVGSSTRTELLLPVRAKRLAGYRWKIGSTPTMKCTNADGYSNETPGHLQIESNIGDIPDGGVTLCALAKNADGIWQPLNQPTIVRWIKVKGKVDTPVAVIKNHPTGTSETTNLDLTISAVTPMTYESYRWKIGPAHDIDCTQAAGYSDELAGKEPAITTIKDMPDGDITVCAVAKNNKDIWQPYSAPTSVTWTKISKKLNIIQKNGYELFRLSAEVLFDFDKDLIRPGAQDDLHRISKYLKGRDFRKVIIEGHTDSMGSDEYNENLSQRRAARVKAWLIENYNFEPQKFEAVGKGEKVPVASNETDEGRQQNRRVEFKIYR